MRYLEAPIRLKITINNRMIFNTHANYNRPIWKFPVHTREEICSIESSTYIQYALRMHDVTSQRGVDFSGFLLLRWDSAEKRLYTYFDYYCLFDWLIPSKSIRRWIAFFQLCTKNPIGTHRIRSIFIKVYVFLTFSRVKSNNILGFGAIGRLYESHTSQIFELQRKSASFESICSSH